MKTPEEWLAELHPEGLGIEERERFIEMVQGIQDDVLADPWANPTDTILGI